MIQNLEQNFIQINGKKYLQQTQSFGSNFNYQYKHPFLSIGNVFTNCKFSSDKKSQTCDQNFEAQKLKRNIHKEKQIQVQDKSSQFLFYKLKQQGRMPKKSQGILYFKQNYECVYRSKNLSSTTLKEVIVKCYSKSSSQNEEQQIINSMSIVIQKDFIKLWRLNQAEITTNLKSEQFIFPQNPLKSWSFLERRVWIQINKKLNKISINEGDIQSVEQSKTARINQSLCSSIKQKRLNWKNCQKTYQQSSNQDSKSYQNQIENPLMNIDSFQIYLKLQFDSTSVMNKNIKISRIPQSIKIKCLGLQAKKPPQLKQNATIFQPKISQIGNMPENIKQLYYRLKPLNLFSLCGSNFQLNQDREIPITDQLIFMSISNSLAISYRLVQLEVGKAYPLGILNHMLKMKTDFQLKQLLNQSIDFKNPQEIYKEITQKRVGYIRFQIAQPKGCYPGSQAVLQIWPPFYSSPIHNHGQAFGLIKVLAGQIHVQNFSDLTFCDTKKPYSTTNYFKDQYSWFSEESYCIHRVINISPSPCITLQGYYDHSQGAQQYFSFINCEKDQKTQKTTKKLAIYYPQHDWQNYLNKRGIDKTEDKQFIENVIETYRLRDQKDKSNIDCSFGKFVQCLVGQYNFVQRITSNKSF